MKFVKTLYGKKIVTKNPNYERDYKLYEEYKKQLKRYNERPWFARLFTEPQRVFVPWRVHVHAGPIRHNFKYEDLPSLEVDGWKIVKVVMDGDDEIDHVELEKWAE